MFHLIILMILPLVGLTLYFVPSVIAFARRADRAAGILALNFLLGWTVLGWIGSLVWAIAAETKEQAYLRAAAFHSMASRPYNPHDYSDR